MGIGLDNCQDMYITRLSITNIQETSTQEVNRRAVTLGRDSLNKQHCQVYRENYKELFGKYHVIERPERWYQQKRGSEFMVVSKYLNRSSAIV